MLKLRPVHSSLYKQKVKTSASKKLVQNLVKCTVGLSGNLHKSCLGKLVISQLFVEIVKNLALLLSLKPDSPFCLKVTLERTSRVGHPLNCPALSCARTTLIPRGEPNLSASYIKNNQIWNPPKKDKSGSDASSYSLIS